MRVKVLLGALALFTTPLVVGQGELVSGQSEDIKQPVDQSNAIQLAPVIGYLETRDQRIAIKAGDVYTISTKDGKVLAEDVTLQQLQATNPSLHEILHVIAANGRIQDVNLKDE